MGLRRSVLSSIFIFCGANFTIISNNSNFESEYISHRMGMIPYRLLMPMFTRYHAGEKIIDLVGICYLHASNTISTSPKNVCFSDMKYNYYSNGVKKGPLQKIKHFFICKIFCGQTIKIISEIRKGCGKKNSKWLSTV